MGEVYKATDTRLDRTVAVKVISEQIAGNIDLRARFEREARAVALLDHPHICAVYDVGQQDDVSYLVKSVSRRGRTTNRGPSMSAGFHRQGKEGIVKEGSFGRSYRSSRERGFSALTCELRRMTFRASQSTRCPGRV